MTAVALVVVGAGGFGRETLDVVEAINLAAREPVFALLGVIDESPSFENVTRLAKRGVPYLGTCSAWLESRNDALYLIGIGNPDVRQRIDTAFSETGLLAATAIHPNATIGSVATIGEGSIVCAGVQVSTNVTLGRHVHLNPNATIGHDSVLNDFVSVNPAAVVSGDVTLGERTLVGAGAVILQGLSIGSSVVIGGSACVVRDVENQLTVKGVPAR